MKKLIIGAICIILLTGCGSEKNVKQQDTKQVEQQVENNANLQKTSWTSTQPIGANLINIFIGSHSLIQITEETISIVFK